MAQHLLGTRFAPHSFSKTIKKHKNVECTVIDQSICSKVRAPTQIAFKQKLYVSVGFYRPGIRAQNG